MLFLLWIVLVDLDVVLGDGQLLFQLVLLQVLGQRQLVDLAVVVQLGVGVEADDADQLLLDVVLDLREQILADAQIPAPLRGPLPPILVLFPFYPPPLVHILLDEQGFKYFVVVLVVGLVLEVFDVEGVLPQALLPLPVELPELLVYVGVVPLLLPLCLQELVVVFLGVLGDADALENFVVLGAVVAGPLVAFLALLVVALVFCYLLDEEVHVVLAPGCAFHGDDLRVHEFPFDLVAPVFTVVRLLLQPLLSALLLLIVFQFPVFSL